MSVSASVFSGLHGALLLARGRSEGVRYVSDDMRMAARSFSAALICAPLFVGVLLLGWMQTGAPADMPHVVALELLSFVISWAGYAVISRPVVAAHAPGGALAALHRDLELVQRRAVRAAAGGDDPGRLGAPFWLTETSQLVAQGWALWLEWFAIRLSLEVTGVQAAVVMTPDVLLGLVLAALVAGT